MSKWKKSARQEQSLREQVQAIKPAPGFARGSKKRKRVFAEDSRQREKVLRSQGNRKPKGQR
jgi:hypothetical protein